MIFIIIAIVVLVVSFSVALFSLVREQKKFEDEDETSTKPSEQSITEEKAPKIADPLSTHTMPLEESVPPSSEEGQISKPTDEISPVVDQEVPFPWEEVEGGAGGNAQGDEQEKIDQIRVALQKMTKTTKDEVVSASESEAQTIPEQRLSGEFQIKKND